MLLRQVNFRPAVSKAGKLLCLAEISLFVVGARSITAQYLKRTDQNNQAPTIRTLLQKILGLHCWCSFFYPDLEQTRMTMSPGSSMHICTVRPCVHQNPSPSGCRWQIWRKSLKVFEIPRSRQWNAIWTPWPLTKKNQFQSSFKFDSLNAFLKNCVHKKNPTVRRPVNTTN